MDVDQPEVNRGKGSGGFIQIRDGRVSAGIAWALGILATLVGTGICWVGYSLVGIRESLAALAATSQAQTVAIVAQLNKNDARDEAQEARINNIDGRLYSLEGRTLRGGPHEAR